MDADAPYDRERLERPQSADQEGEAMSSIIEEGVYWRDGAVWVNLPIVDRTDGNGINLVDVDTDTLPSGAVLTFTANAWKRLLEATNERA
jgi:hypothetical protein